MKKIAAGFFIIAMLTLSVLFLSWSGLIRLPSASRDSVRFPHLKSLILNRQGNQQLQAQNYSSAFDTYVKALEFDPFASEIHLDLGLSYEGQQQAAKALTSYQNSWKYAANDTMKFFSLFNQAQLLGKDKKVDEALELYQKALAFDPTSKEVKTNIELLIQTQQQQQQQQDGQGKNQEQKQDPKKDPQDQKDQKDSKNQDSKDNKDPKQDPKDKEKKDNPQYSPNQKYKPRPFKGQELSEGDVKKILGEIKQQEQKIRSEYNRKEVKEQPRDKDW